MGLKNINSCNFHNNSLRGIITIITKTLSSPSSLFYRAKINNYSKSQLLNGRNLFKPRQVWLLIGTLCCPYSMGVGKKNLQNGFIILFEVLENISAIVVNVCRIYYI